MPDPVFTPTPELQVCIKVIRTLRQAGHEAYIAGGAVRDAMLGRPQKDLDIATSALPDESRQLFNHTIPVGESFGVLIVRMGGCSFELATFREEGGYQDGRHPTELHFSNARADVMRRDFTINGMLWDPLNEELHDWVGGRKDLEAGLIRTIGAPEDRFAEDHLRMLRALRFSAQLGFSIDGNSFRSIQRMATRITTVSMERIEQELGKLFSAPGFRANLVRLVESGLLAPIRAKLLEEAPKRWQQLHAHVVPPAESAWQLALSTLIDAPDESELLAVWCAFLLDTAAWQPGRLMPETAIECAAGVFDLARALRVPRTRMTQLAACARLLSSLPAWPELTLAGRLRLLREPEFPAAFLLARATESSQLPQAGELARLRLAHEAVWFPRPLLTGTELLELGVPHGPSLGACLAALEDLQLEGKVDSHEDAVAWVTTEFGANKPS